MSDTVLTGYSAALLDLDGTVYHGAKAITGVADALAAARKTGTALRFVTNNASKSPQEVAAQLNALGVEATVDEVRTSAQAAARLLRDRLPAGARVLVVGAAALADEVRAVGLVDVREADDDVRAVVQGHSPDTGWAQLAEACVAIRAGALWVASNTDATLPAERGLLPGNGSMVAALRTATDAEPLVAGKPATPLFDADIPIGGGPPPLVIGDRLDTDIAGAVAAGLDSLLVLTGVATPRQVLTAVPAQRPRYLAADLAGLSAQADELVIGPQRGWDIQVEGDRVVATAAGSTDPLALLRGLCDAAWRVGAGEVDAADETAATALAALSLRREGDVIG